MNLSQPLEYLRDLLPRVAIYTKNSIPLLFIFQSYLFKNRIYVIVHTGWNVVMRLIWKPEYLQCLLPIFFKPLFWPMSDRIYEWRTTFLSLPEKQGQLKTLFRALQKLPLAKINFRKNPCHQWNMNIHFTLTFTRKHHKIVKPTETIRQQLPKGA